MGAEEFLPREIFEKASLVGKEYAWPISEIPSVIEAARKSNLLNVGGQLQFRTPGGTCECYWIEVDTFKVVPDTLPWAERIDRSASEALKAYTQLAQTKDFLAEGRNNFDYLVDYEKTGGSLAEAMCFVWYVKPPGARDFAD